MSIDEAIASLKCMKINELQLEVLISSEVNRRADPKVKILRAILID